jgi:hypothetical protein
MSQRVTTTEHIVFSPDTVSNSPVAGIRPAFIIRLNHQTTQNSNKAGRSLYRGEGGGGRSSSVPWGRAKIDRGALPRPSLRDWKRFLFLPVSPAVNCWAIFDGPYGTKDATNGKAFPAGLAFPFLPFPLFPSTKRPRFSPVAPCPPCLRVPSPVSPSPLCIFHFALCIPPSSSPGPKTDIDPEHPTCYTSRHYTGEGAKVKRSERNSPSLFPRKTSPQKPRTVLTDCATVPSAQRPADASPTQDRDPMRQESRLTNG